MLCDKTAKACVQCLANTDCPTDYFCAPNETCQVEVCKPSTTTCSAGSLVTCNATGNTILSSTLCSQGCEVASTGASCIGDSGTVVDSSAADTGSDTAVADTSPPASAVVWDFGQTCTESNTKGTWLVAGAPDSYSFASAPSLSWSDQSCGAYIIGSCTYCTTTGLELLLANPFDFSSFSGITLTVESSSNLTLVLASTGGSQYAMSLPANGSTETRQVAFSSAWATAAQASSISTIYIYIASTTSTGGYGMGVHKIAAY
jgi:hypothetical protein